MLPWESRERLTYICRLLECHLRKGREREEERDTNPGRERAPACVPAGSSNEGKKEVVSLSTRGVFDAWLFVAFLRNCRTTE